MPRRFIGIASKTMYDGPEMIGDRQGQKGRERERESGRPTAVGVRSSLISGDGQRLLFYVADGAETSI